MPSVRETTQTNQQKACTSFLWYGMTIALFGESVGLILFGLAAGDRHVVIINLLMAAFWLPFLIYFSFRAHSRFTKMMAQ